MKYFLELINSYKGRGCCITRIDEKAKPKAAPKEKSYDELNQDFTSAFPAIKAAIDQNPQGATLEGGTVGTNKQGVYKIKFSPEPRDTAQITNRGLFTTKGLNVTEKSLKRFHTIYFGKQEDGEAAQDQQATQQEQPQLTPEQLEAQQKEAEAKSMILKYLQPLLDKVWNSAENNPNKNVLCKLKIGKAIAMSQRNLRGDRRRKGDTSPADIKRGDEAYKQFQKGKHCEALKIFLDTKWAKRLMLDKKRFIEASTNTGQKLSVNAISKLIALSADQITTALFNIDCPRNIKRQECVKLNTESLKADNKDGEKARKKFEKVMKDLSSDKELSPDRLAEIRETLIFTRQGDMIIRIAPDKGIVVSDGDRLMFDAFSKGMRDKGIPNPIVYDLEQKPVSGDLINVRGKTFEHMFSILSFMDDLQKAKGKKEKEKIKKAYADYLGSIDRLCTFLTAMESLVDGYEDNEFSINESDLVEFNHIRDQVTEAEGCLNLAKTFNASLGRAQARYRLMDADKVLQVGSTVGDGTREDVVYLYDDEAKAREKAAMLGLEPELKTLSEIMRNNQDYADAIGFNPETDDKEVWVVPDGLKMSANNRACFGNGGRAKNVTLLSADESELNEDQRNWIRKTSEALGLSEKDVAAIRGPMREFGAELEETERLITDLHLDNKVIGKNGKATKESGLGYINSQMEDRKKQLKGLDPISDPVYQNLNELKELMQAKPLDQSAVDAQKKSVIRAMQHEQTKKFITESLDRHPNGKFKDPTRSKAAAMFLLMSGSTNKDMSTSVIGVGKRSRGSPVDYIVPHNKALGDYFRRALQGDNSVGIEFAEDESKDFYTRVRTNDEDGNLCQVEFINKPNGAMSSMINKGAIRDNAIETPESLGESENFGSKLLQLLIAQKNILMEFMSR